MTAGKTTAQVFGLFGLLATAISLGFTAADVASNIALGNMRQNGVRSLWIRLPALPLSGGAGGRTDGPMRLPVPSVSPSARA